ncbi:MAG TPA: glycerophosphodiester phosphodiesterase [Longimicrobiales bacterium]|nr:glycerophosphodiester phosphodiesterase [Longimicrobiales bacterium]
MIVIGHRGAAGHAPEHTFASYDLAATIGVDYLEQDLQMTSDGVLVCMHDPTLDRTTNGHGDVIAHTIDDVQKLDAGTWFNKSFEGEHVPTLRQVFQRYGSKHNYYIETKNPEEAPGMEQAVLDLINEFKLRDGAVQRWQVLIQSFSRASLLKIKSLDPELPLIQLIGKEHDSPAIQAELDIIKTYAVGIGPSRLSVDAPLVDAVHAHNLHIHPYTVNEVSEMQRMMELGVDGMFSDFPDRLVQLLD